MRSNQLWVKGELKINTKSLLIITVERIEIGKIPSPVSLAMFDDKVYVQVKKAVLMSKSQIYVRIFYESLKFCIVNLSKMEQKCFKLSQGHHECNNRLSH